MTCAYGGQTNWCWCLHLSGISDTFITSCFLTPQQFSLFSVFFPFFRPTLPMNLRCPRSAEAWHPNSSAEPRRSSASRMLKSPLQAINATMESIAATGINAPTDRNATISSPGPADLSRVSIEQIPTSQRVLTLKQLACTTVQTKDWE